MGARRGLRAVLALGALAASAHGQSIAMVLLLQFKIIRLLEQPWSTIDSLAVHTASTGGGARAPARR